MKVKVCFNLNATKVKVSYNTHATVAPAPIALDEPLAEGSSAERINEALEGVDWVLQACIENLSEIDETGRASLLQSRETINTLLGQADLQEES